MHLPINEFDVDGRNMPMPLKVCPLGTEFTGCLSESLNEQRALRRFLGVADTSLRVGSQLLFQHLSFGGFCYDVERAVGVFESGDDLFNGEETHFETFL